MYQSMMANIQQIHTNSDGTVCITPMQVDVDSEPSRIQQQYYNRCQNVSNFSGSINSQYSDSFIQSCSQIAVGVGGGGFIFPPSLSYLRRNVVLSAGGSAAEVGGLARTGSRSAAAILASHIYNPNPNSNLNNNNCHKTNVTKTTYSGCSLGSFFSHSWNGNVGGRIKMNDTTNMNNEVEEEDMSSNNDKDDSSQNRSIRVTQCNGQQQEQHGMVSAEARPLQDPTMALMNIAALSTQPTSSNDSSIPASSGSACVVPPVTLTTVTDSMMSFLNSLNMMPVNTANNNDNNQQQQQQQLSVNPQFYREEFERQNPSSSSSSLVHSNQVNATEATTKTTLTTNNSNNNVVNISDDDDGDDDDVFILPDVNRTNEDFQQLMVENGGSLFKPLNADEFTTHHHQQQKQQRFRSSTRREQLHRSLRTIPRMCLRRRTCESQSMVGATVIATVKVSKAANSREKINNKSVKKLMIVGNGKCSDKNHNNYQQKNNNCNNGDEDNATHENGSDESANASLQILSPSICSSSSSSLLTI